MICIGCDDNDDIVLTLEQKPLPSDTINRIIMHEFGHAVGLGHYIEDVISNNNIPSLMYPMMNPFGQNSFAIENIDKEALKKIYNEDGFGGMSGEKPYYFEIKITPHGFVLE